MRLLCRTTNEGFTLIEVLIAIFIGSIVLTVLYVSFFQIIKAKERTEEELEFYHEANAIMSRITKDLASAHPIKRVNSQLDNANSQFFLAKREYGNSSLEFTSLSGNPSFNHRESDQTEISYFVKPLEDPADLFALVRGNKPVLGVENNTQYTLSERIVRFDLAHPLNPKDPRPDKFDDKYLLEWDSSITSTLPKAVRVRLVMRDIRGEDVEFSSLVLMPAAN